jgi:hypothetical protein
MAASLGLDLVLDVESSDARAVVPLDRLCDGLGRMVVRTSPPGVATTLLVLVLTFAPPKPVSASAIRGTVGSIEAIIDPLATKSVNPANPRSGRPRRDAVVAAPDWYCGGSDIGHRVRYLYTCQI